MTTFKNLYAVAKDITYNPKWANDTGYFDNVADAGLSCMSRFIDEHGRKVVVIPANMARKYFPDQIRPGVIVINQRYSKHDSPIVTQTYYKKETNSVSYIKVSDA